MSKSNIIKPIKRVPVRNTFFLTDSEKPVLLLQTQRTSNGEIYRVLMSVVLNKKTHHKFFLDRQVTGELDTFDKSKLCCLNSFDWNTSQDYINNRQVLSPIDFIDTLLKYLENFKQYELGMVKVICWAEDADFFRPILAKCRHMDPNPTIFEEMASVYGLKAKKDMKITQNQAIIKTKGIWTPIEIDLQIWNYLSP